MEEYKVVIDRDEFAAPHWVSINKMEAWTESKTEKLNELSIHLLETVARFRPEIKSARMLGFSDGEHKLLITKPKIAGFGEIVSINAVGALLDPTGATFTASAHVLETPADDVIVTE